MGDGNKHMRVYIILEQSHVWGGAVRASIKAQTGVGDIEIVECRSSGDPVPGAGHTPARIASEKVNRLHARDLAVASGDEFCVIQDRAYLHAIKGYVGPKWTVTPQPGNFLAMRDYLVANPTVGAVSIVPIPGEHVDVGCCMWRVSVLAKLTLEGWTTGCACNAVKAELDAIGAGIVYLPGELRTTKI